MITITKGSHTHQNVREEQNRYLSFYHKYRKVMSVSKKRQKNVTGKSIKVMLSSFCQKGIIRINQPSTNRSTNINFT